MSMLYTSNNQNMTPRQRCFNFSISEKQFSLFKYTFYHSSIITQHKIKALSFVFYIKSQKSIFL